MPELPANRVCRTLGAELPVLAFSHCRDVVAAVSDAGGIGVLGAVGFDPDQLDRELTWLDEHVPGRTYGVDVLCGSDAPPGVPGHVPEEHRRFIADLLARHDVPVLPADEALGLLAQPSDEQRTTELVEVALSHRPVLLANALGPTPQGVVDSAHARGVVVAALVGTPDQAVRQVEAGVDLVVAQGTEAGGHTGEIATMVLVPDVVDAIAPVPVVAAGGIADGRQMAAAFALGAEAVWCGSVWLTTRESDLGPVVVRKLLAASASDTTRSRSLTGKPSRMLRTAWTQAWAAPDAPPTLPRPLQMAATAEAWERIIRYEPLELAGTPVGQVVGAMHRSRSSAAVLLDLVTGFTDVVAELAGMLDEGAGAVAEPL